MKRLLILIVAFLALLGVFAQQSVDLNLQGMKTETIILGGPVPSYPVVLSLEVSYQPKEELVTVVVKGDNRVADTHISSKKTKDQITHLLFPINCNGFHYKNINFQTYFKGAAYNSNAVLETQMKQQTSSKNDTDIFRSVFEVVNGEIKNKSENDIILPLQDGKLTLTIKVMDLDKPVVLTINNVIPFHAEKEGSLQFNKFHLKYISNSSLITFNLPKDKCARQYGLIQQYEKLNKNMNTEVDRLMQFVRQNDDDINSIIQRQWSLIYKYKKTQEEVDVIETECEQLLEQFAYFNNYYNQIKGVNALTPDSLQTMLEILDLFRKRLTNARNGASCSKLKKEAVKYIADVDLDENAFDTLREAYSLVLQFNELKKSIKGFNCPIDKPQDTIQIPIPPKPNPPTTQCDCQEIITAKNDLAKLWNEYQVHKTKKISEYTSIVTKTDNIINSMPKSCQKKCEVIINDYRNRQKNYEDKVIKKQVK